MAAGRLPAPGTEFGPCEECGHIDCAETRSMAKVVCKYCETEIGYDRRFYDLGGKELVHASCHEDAIISDEPEVPEHQMDAISAMIHEKIAKNTFNAAAIANGLRFGDLPDDEARIARARLYRHWRHAGENVQAAFDRAIRGEEPPPQFDLQERQP